MLREPKTLSTSVFVGSHASIIEIVPPPFLFLDTNII